MTNERAVWVTFRDEHDPEWSWEFDVAFLTSGYGCIYGNGCKGTDEDGTLGCCADGVYVVEGEDDEEGRQNLLLLEQRVAQMDESDWQFKAEAERRGEGREGWIKPRAKGEQHTRLHKGACIFANRADHPGGPGCAFHAAALKRGENPLDWKPRNCWMVPMQLDTDANEKTRTIRAFQNKEDWGDGEEEVCSWWCIDDEIAYQHDTPLYVRVREELERMCGPSITAKLIAWLDRYMTIEDGPGRTPVNYRGIKTRKQPNGLTGIPLPMASSNGQASRRMGPKKRKAQKLQDSGLTS